MNEDYWVYDIADRDSIVIWQESVCGGSIVGKAALKGKEFFFYADTKQRRGSFFGTGQGELLHMLFHKAEQCERRLPIVYFFNCCGANLKEKTAALDSYARVFREFVGCEDDHLQVGVVCGNCVGGSAYLASMCDVILFSGSKGNLCLTGPKIVYEFMGEICSKEELGGYQIHSKNETITQIFEDEAECREQLETLLSAFYQKERPYEEPEQPLDSRILPMTNKPYDVREIIHSLMDRNSFKETSGEFSLNLVTGIGRAGGIHVGILANQPMVLAGTIDCDAAEKGIRFLKQCKKLKLPLLVISDVPSFLPGTLQEKKGIEMKGGRFLKAMIRLDTPKITLILHKSFDGAYIAMNSLGLGADQVYAWPGSTIGIMGGRMSASLSKGISHLSLEDHLKSGSLSGIIMPEDTRKILIQAFQDGKNREVR